MNSHIHNWNYCYDHVHECVYRVTQIINLSNMCFEIWKIHSSIQNQISFWLIAITTSLIKHYFEKDQIWTSFYHYVYVMLYFNETAVTRDGIP